MVLEHTSEVVGDLSMPAVENAGLEVVLVAKIRDGNLVGHVTADDGGLFLGG